MKTKFHYIIVWIEFHFLIICPLNLYLAQKASNLPYSEIGFSELSYVQVVAITLSGTKGQGINDCIPFLTTIHMKIHSEGLPDHMLSSFPEPLKEQPLYADLCRQIAQWHPLMSIQ